MKCDAKGPKTADVNGREAPEKRVGAASLKVPSQTQPRKGEPARNTTRERTGKG